MSSSPAATREFEPRPSTPAGASNPRGEARFVLADLAALEGVRRLAVEAAGARRGRTIEQDADVFDATFRSQCAPTNTDTS